MSCGRQPIERRKAGPHRSRRWHPPHTRVVFSDMRRSVPCLIGTSFVTLLGALGAQQVPSFKSGVDVVLIDVTVVDPTGRPVTDLRPEDFRITVDRKPRTIASAKFIRHDTRASVTALPKGSRATPTGSPGRGSVPAAITRDVLIVIDTDSMEPGDGLLVRKAVKGFLDQLAPDDRVGVATVPWLKSEVELSRLRSGARKLLDSVMTGSERFRSREFEIGVSEAYEAVLRKDAQVMQRLIQRNCRDSRDFNCPYQVKMETQQVATQEQDPQPADARCAVRHRRRAAAAAGSENAVVRDRWPASTRPVWGRGLRTTRIVPRCCASHPLHAVHRTTPVRPGQAPDITDTHR